MNCTSVLANDPAGGRLTLHAPSFDGTTIRFDLYEAPDATRLAVVIPGFWRGCRDPVMPPFARWLSRFGITVAVVDPRGHGESGGRYGFNLHEHEDVAAVIRAIFGRATFSEVLLIGFSIGAAIAVSTAARHALPVSGLLLISACAELRMVRPRVNPFAIHRHVSFGRVLHPPRVDWRALAGPRPSTPEDIAAVHVPVSLLHARNDWLVHHRHSELLYSHANEPRDLRILDLAAGYHADRILTAEPEILESEIRRFLFSQGWLEGWTEARPPAPVLEA